MNNGIDAGPRRTLRPLGAALAVAVLLGAGGAATARALHHPAPATAGQHRHATPTPAPRGTATPSTPAQSLRFPPLFPADDLTVGAPQAYGHLALTGTDSTLAVSAYRLAVTADPGSPATAPVWRIDRSPPRDAASLGARFGVAGAGLDYDPEHGYISFHTTTMPDLATLPRLDGVPTDTTVSQLGLDFLSRRGLEASGLQKPRVVSNTGSARPDLEAWALSFPRNLTTGKVYGDGGGFTMSIGAQGVVSAFNGSVLRVAGGSAYPLISWRQAWNQVAAGHWYLEYGGFTGGNAPSRADTFRATTVELGYVGLDWPLAQMSAAERDYFISMWVFGDGGGLRLFYPAVASSGLTYTWAPKPWPTGTR